MRRTHTFAPDPFVGALKPRSTTLKVVTPSIRLGVLLCEKLDVDLRILGGRIVQNSMSTRDEYSLQGLRNVRCSKLFSAATDSVLRMESQARLWRRHT